MPLYNSGQQRCPNGDGPSNLDRVSVQAWTGKIDPVLVGTGLSKLGRQIFACPNPVPDNKLGKNGENPVPGGTARPNAVLDFYFTNLRVLTHVRLSQKLVGVRF